MPAGKIIALPFSLLFLIACIFLSACSKSEQSVQSEVVPPPTPLDRPIDLRPPQLPEVQEAIKRVYGQTLTIESGSVQVFIAGDFNGDSWPDLAVAAKPTEGSLAELNDELANWTLGDPMRTSSDPGKNSKPDRIHLEQNDLLLAIIHGYGSSGWREPQARQTYLLKNAIGSSMKLQTFKESLKLVHQRIRLPRLRGDVIKQTLAGEEGFLYYDGARYAWHRFASPLS